MICLLATIACCTRPVMHMCKEHMAQQVGVVDRPWLIIMHYLWRSWPVQNDSKYTDTETSFSLISRYSFASQVAQGPRSPKLVIFVQTTTTDIQTDCFSPCACARGNYNITLYYWRPLPYVYMYLYICTFDDHYWFCIYLNSINSTTCVYIVHVGVHDSSRLSLIWMGL